jgi:energy-coupling factor transporter ATP-binding protein EcfA2
MVDSEGNTIGLCGIARDISEYRERERGSGKRVYESRSPVMRDVIKQIRRVATSDSTVLLLGESGCGKDYMARFLHDVSHRASGRSLVSTALHWHRNSRSLNCSAMSRVPSPEPVGGNAVSWNSQKEEHFFSTKSVSYLWPCKQSSSHFSTPNHLPESGEKEA